MRVLVLGATGMAGHIVAEYLKENDFEVESLARKPLNDKTYAIDVTDMKELDNFLGDHAYDAVINCIGLLVTQSEDQKALAVYINSYLPHMLEDRFRSGKTKLIHISSNGVFSPNHAPHIENAPYDGTSFYGRSKALGEVVNEKDLTIRLSIIGPDLEKDSTGLFNWFFGQSGEIGGYTNVIWNGITTIELAKSIKAMLQQDIIGIYHLTPKETISKFGLLKLLKETFERDDIQIKPVEGTASDSTLLNTREDFKYHTPDYETMMLEMKEWIKQHPTLYPHYGKMA